MTLICESILQAVFDIGREDIVLALDGLKSLENVYSKIPLQDFEVVLVSVIPHLRYYLETSRKKNSLSFKPSIKNFFLPVIKVFGNESD